MMIKTAWKRFWGLLFVLSVMAACPPLGVRAADGPAAEKLSLEVCIAAALRHNGLYGAAMEGIRGATARKQEAFTAFLPRLSTSWSYLRLNDDPWVYSPGYVLNLFGTTVTIPPGPQVIGTKENYTWNVEFRQPLFTGGALRANYEAGEKGETLAKAEETAIRQDLVAEVKTSYVNVLKAQRLLRVAEKTVELVAAHLADARHFFAEGLIPHNDLLQSEVRHANSRQDLLRAQNAMELAKARLNLLMGRPLDTVIDLDDILTYAPFSLDLGGCLAAGRENRAELKAAEIKVQQAELLVRATRAELFPTISALGRYERYGDTGTMQGSTYRSMENWQLMARADWNFWEWGRTKYRIDAERAKKRQAEYLLSQERDRVALEIKAAYLLLKEAEGQVEITRCALEQARENFRVSRERYREHMATSTEVLDALTLLTKAETDHHAALGDYSIHQARLTRAIGLDNTGS